MTKLKQTIYETIDGMESAILAINDYIHSHPEIGNQEFQAVELLTRTLAEHRFEVERNVAGLATAFKATYRNGEGGPVIGLLCEYDALEGLGHGCGHHMQAASITGAAIALSRCLGEIPATIEVFGTPAEETTSGKVPMVKAGVFDHLDVALMMHGGDRTTVDGKTLAMNKFDFIFKGKSAHAAVAPEQGVSALDGVLLAYHALEYLREHVRSDVKIHGVITNGGVAPNMVPDYASAQYYVRANDRQHLNTVLERVFNAVRGAALATGTTVTIEERKATENKINVERLNKLLLDNAVEAGSENISPPRTSTGSTDFANVTHRVPGACLRVAFVPLGTSSHTEEWVKAGVSPEGQQAVMLAAKAIAGSAFDLIVDPALLKEIQAEYAVVKQV